VNRPVVSYGRYRGVWGEFSTVVLPGGLVETCFFPDRGESEVIAHSGCGPVESVHRVHVREFSG
jgi:hypothetical protein